MRRRKGRPEPIGSLLERLFIKKGWESKLLEQKLISQWAYIVGAQLAQRSRPLKLHNGRLSIIVQNSAWLTQLQFMKLEIIDKIKEKLNFDIDEISLQIGT